MGGAPSADVDAAGTGFLRSFLNADIYFSPETGAHEVHGAIRDKYNTRGGAAGPLGLPLTDETGAPDGEGRFNHFQGGSIYWTERNGAAMVAARSGTPGPPRAGRPASSAIPSRTSTAT